ncbi:MAG: DUF3782 domain-containing protein [bacterium]|nr:DUF3782 domain-containing protein [bacterium]
MTAEELMEMIAENGRLIRGLRDSQAEAGREWRESHAETERTMLLGFEKIQQKLDAFTEQQNRTDKQLGELGNRLGGFTEGLVLPSVREILLEQLHMDVVVKDVRARRNGDSFQIDTLGYTNGDANVACLVEVKSYLREEGLQQILKHLRRFGDFFPEHHGKTLYGMLAAIDVDEEMEKRVLRQGIYLVKVQGGLCRLCQLEGFQPRSFPC